MWAELPGVMLSIVTMGVVLLSVPPVITRPKEEGCWKRKIFFERGGG